MNKYWIILAGLMLTACKSLPEPQGDIEGLSFIKLGDQEAVVFENRNDIKLIYGNTKSGEIFKFNNGKWIFKAPNLNWFDQLDSSYDEKLVIPLNKGFSFVFLQKNDPFPRAFEDKVKNPCEVARGCPWPPRPIAISVEDFLRLFPIP